MGFHMTGAARIGDVTAHGGVISSGCDKVLIEGKAAARVGDMHLCPMMNPGPLPHVGGTISNGVASVLINGSPAATSGSMCQCVGWPDNVQQGALTVVIGSRQTASRGSRECLNSLHQYRLQQAQPATPWSRGHYLDLRFSDDAGKHLLSLPYSLRRQGMSTQYGQLDGNGRLQRYRLSQPGRYCVQLLSLTRLAWDRPQAAYDESVQLHINWSDRRLQQAQPVAIYALYGNAQSVRVAQLQLRCQNGRVQHAWRLPFLATPRFPLRGYYFEIDLGAQRMRSPLLRLRHRLQLHFHGLAQFAGRPLALSFVDATQITVPVATDGECRSEHALPGVFHFDAGVVPLFAE